MTGPLRAALLATALLAVGGCRGPADGAEGDAPGSDGAVADVAWPPPALRGGADEPASEAPVTATLFTVGGDGRLRPRTVELPPVSGTRARAEALVSRIVEESGAFPEGTRVLDVFVSTRGEAVVNFSGELLAAHPGGLTAEELTVYSLSHALVSSFPAIAEVRVIVEGRRTETLAGHLDLSSGFAGAPRRLLPSS